MNSRTMLGSTLIALIALLAMAAGGASAFKGKTVHIWNCTHATVKPHKVVFTCADGNDYLDRVKYKSYGGKTASGSGRLNQNTCTPNCAHGHFSHEKAKLRFYRIVSCSDGNLYYSRVSITPKSARKSPSLAKLGPAKGAASVKPEKCSVVK
jgi:hypothetical protein